MRPADELRETVEAYLGALAFAPELGALEESIRYSLESGGKRIRPVLCLAVAEAAGGSVDDALPAAAAIEHFTSLRRAPRRPDPAGRDDRTPVVAER